MVSGGTALVRVQGQKRCRKCSLRDGEQGVDDDKDCANSKRSQSQGLPFPWHDDTSLLGFPLRPCIHSLSEVPSNLHFFVDWTLLDDDLDTSLRPSGLRRPL